MTKEIKHKDGSVLWQIQQNIKSKKLLIQSNDDDIKRSQKRREDAMEELAEYIAMIRFKEADSMLAKRSKS